MDRWHVYTWLKQYYALSGKVPSINAINCRFPNILAEELSEGIFEFIMNVGGQE